MRVNVGLRVDSTVDPVPALLALWRAHLGNGAVDETPYWSAAERRRWPVLNLAMRWVVGDADPAERLHGTVVDIAPAHDSADTGAYVIRTLFAYDDPKRHATVPVGLVRVYATREGNRWVLGNALPRLTHHWPSRKVGVITFVHEPSHRFDGARARQSATFVDSVAVLFGIPSPPDIGYYVTDTPEEMTRILGLDFAVPGMRGRAFTEDRLILSGSPDYGEYYPHELAHIVLRPFEAEAHTPFEWDEAVAMWLGGSRGRSFPELMRALADTLHVHPDLTLTAIVGEPRIPTVPPYPSLAALIQMAYEKDGMLAVKQVLTSPGEGEQQRPLGPAERVLGLSPADLNAAWRSRVSRYAP
jgi:hypothetical protein